MNIPELTRKLEEKLKTSQEAHDKEVFTATLTPPKEAFQDAFNRYVGTEIKYPVRKWQPIGETLLSNDARIGPSGNDIWLLCLEGGNMKVRRYVNWSGWRGDMEKLRSEVKVVAWAPVDEPIIEGGA